MYPYLYNYIHHMNTIFFFERGNYRGRRAEGAKGEEEI